MLKHHLPAGMSYIAMKPVPWNKYVNPVVLSRVNQSREGHWYVVIGSGKQEACAWFISLTKWTTSVTCTDLERLEKGHHKY